MAAPTVGTAGTASAATGGACSPTLPAGIAADDIVVCWLIQCHDGTGTTASSITWPAGYTQGQSVEIKSSAGVSRGRAGWAWKRTTGADSGTISITPVGGSSGAESSSIANCVAVRGCRASGNPYETDTVNNPDYSDTVDWPAVTTTGPNDTLLILFLHGDNVNIGTPASHTAVISNATTNGKDAAADADKRENMAAGTHDPANGTVGANDGTGWATFQIAFTDGAAAATIVVTEAGDGANAAAATSIVVTLTAGIAIGDTVLVIYSGTTGVISSVADSRGNSYTLAKNESGGPSRECSVFYAVVTTALLVSDTVTVTLSASSSRSLAKVIGVSGLSTTPLDQTASGFSGTSATTWTAGTTAVTSQADEIVFGFFATVTSAATTPGGGYTLLTSHTSGGTTPARLSSEYQIVSAAAAYSPTVTGTSTTWGAVTVTLKAAAAPGTTVTRDIALEL